MGVSILWIGRRGMSFHNLKETLYSELASKAAPKYIVIHVGGNDLRSTDIKEFKKLIDRDISELANFLPDTVLIWSDILPRISWGKDVDLAETKRIEIKRKRLNRRCRECVISWGGKYIIHRDITPFEPTLFYVDGIHLSDRGNDIFLNVLQASLETFMSYQSVLFFPCF